MKVISVLNSKGGVGKTTTVTTLAVLLAQLDATVLVIDMAPQTNATSIMYQPDSDEEKITICDFLHDKITEENIGYYLKRVNSPSMEYVMKEEEYEGLQNNLMVIAGSENLNDFKVQLNPDGTSLKERLQVLEDYFDYVIIDNDPQFDILAKTTLVAADLVVCPIELDMYSFMGAQRLIGYIANIKNESNQDLIIKGLFPTKYRGLKGQKLIIEKIEEDEIGDFLLDTKIGHKVSVPNSISTGLPLPIYDPNDECTLDYMKLLMELDVLEEDNAKVLSARIEKLNQKIENAKARRRKKK